MVTCTQRQLDPARLGECRLGYFRIGVITPVYQKLMGANQRSLKRRVAIHDVEKDSTTGWREPAHDPQDICGILVEKHQASRFAAAGIVVQLDATVRTLDGVDVGDQIQDEETGRFYLVADEPVDLTDNKTGAFAYRDCPLRWLPYYREG